MVYRFEGRALHQSWLKDRVVEVVVCLIQMVVEMRALF